MPKTIRKKLKDRDEIHGFEVLNAKRTRRLKIPEDLSSPTGYIIDRGRGFFMDQDGNMYIMDATERLISVKEGFAIAVKQ